METRVNKSAAAERHVWNRIDPAQGILAVFLVVLLLSLARYAANGEPRIVSSDESGAESGETGVSMPLYDGLALSWPLTITPDMNWRDGHYAVKFSRIAEKCDGFLQIKLEQDDFRDEVTVNVCEIRPGEFYPLPLEMKALESGQAFITVATEGVAEGEVELACGMDYYGFGEMSTTDGKSLGYTPVQQYYWHITDMEYRVRIACYLLAVLGCIGLFILTASGTADEGRGRCLAVFGVLTATFLAMFYVYDSSILLEPTYAEAVSNFMKYAREESLVSNLLIADAGYLPLFPRLITLFFIKVLRLPAADALYAMQFTGCLACCMIWAFFVLYPFKGLLRLPYRILFCFMVMAACFHAETLFFTNFVYWGILLILLFLISDLTKWSRIGYWGITAVCVLICLSKGAYVIMLPFMALYLLLFWRGLSKRGKIYGFVIMGAALLQMLYSFGGSGDGGSWISSGGGAGQASFWLKLVCRVCMDGASYLVLFLGRYGERIGGLLPFLAVSVCILAAAGLIRKIILPVLHKEAVEKGWRALYALLLFVFASSAFYRITVKEVPAGWSRVLGMSYTAPGDKYEIFCAVAAFLIWIVVLSMVRRETIQTVAVAVFALLMFCCMPRLQLKGFGGTEISDGRIYASDISAGWQQSRQLIDGSSFFVPVREEFWCYSRNATVYQLGEERYYEESAGFNLGDMDERYRSAFTLDEDMPADNVIEVWIRRPDRIAVSPCKAVLLDEEDNVLQEAVQFTSERNGMTGFFFPEPVNGMKTVRFMDETGRPVYFKDYICWVSAW